MRIKAFTWKLKHRRRRSSSRWDCETTFPRLRPRVSVTDGPFPELVLRVRTRPKPDRKQTEREWERNDNIRVQSGWIWRLLLAFWSWHFLHFCHAETESDIEIIRRENVAEDMKQRIQKEMKDTNHSLKPEHRERLDIDDLCWEEATINQKYIKSEVLTELFSYSKQRTVYLIQTAA